MGNEYLRGLRTSTEQQDYRWRLRVRKAEKRGEIISRCRCDSATEQYLAGLLRIRRDLDKKYEGFLDRLMAFRAVDSMEEFEKRSKEVKC